MSQALTAEVNFETVRIIIELEFLRPECDLENSSHEYGLCNCKIMRMSVNSVLFTHFSPIENVYVYCLVPSELLNMLVVVCYMSQIKTFGA